MVFTRIRFFLSEVRCVDIRDTSFDSVIIHHLFELMGSEFLPACMIEIPDHR